MWYVSFYCREYPPRPPATTIIRDPIFTRDSNNYSDE